MKISCDTCGALTTTAGLTFALDKSEKGYRTKMTSFFEELALDIILGVIPKRVEGDLAGGEPKLGLLVG
jgi:hypothetical protein